MDCFTCYFASLSTAVCWNNDAVKGNFRSAFKFITSQFLWQQIFHDKPTALRYSALHIQHRNDHKNKNYKKFMKMFQEIWKGRLCCFGGLQDACLPLVPKFAGSNPAEAVRIFHGEKIPSTPSFGREEKPAVPCRRFTACKRTLNVTWKSAFRQNSRLLFLAH
jgi:hypothetical protein